MGQFKFAAWLAYWYLQNETFEFSSQRWCFIRSSNIPTCFRRKIVCCWTIKYWAKKKGACMKKYAKKLKNYDKIDFDPKEIIEGMSRLKGARRKPTSVALEEELLKELKALASKRGVPYQVLMRLLIADGLKRLKDAA